MPAMLGCNTVCPGCKLRFECCHPEKSSCCNTEGSLHVLADGGLITTTTTTTTTTNLVPPSSLPSPCLSPQMSPSAQLAFVIPSLETTTTTTTKTFPIAMPVPIPIPIPVHIKLKTNQLPEQKILIQNETDQCHLDTMRDTLRVLRQSGWYYETISYRESDTLLRNTDIGTFLVRNSSDPRFYFSLSVQTECGPTSVRLRYLNCYFSLEAQTHLKLNMPSFSNVIELIQYYVKICRSRNNNSQQLQEKQPVWVDEQGKLYSPIILKEPLRKDGECPTLKHLSRLIINKAIQSSNKNKLRINLFTTAYTQLALPKFLQNYLADYPYSI